MTKHILIIEDDMPNYQLVANLAKLEGYEPQHARTCEHGSQWLAQNSPCLILLDLRLPGGMDGYQFAAILKNSADFKHIPIVAVSVQTDPSDAMKALDAGCNYYVAKPFNVKDLREAIRNYVLC
jgi:two-component system, cell cycle response regulator DivK